MNLKKNSCFIDIGANIGLWTFFIAKKGFKVHAFEPSPQPFKHLKDCAQRYPNIQVYPYALGKENHVGLLNLHRASGHNSLIFEGVDFYHKKMKVKIKTLDSHSFSNVGLIKIDTEGFEVPILLGSFQTIKTWQPRLIIEVHFPYKKQLSLIKAILKEHSYYWIIRYKSLINPQPHIIAQHKHTLDLS